MKMWRKRAESSNVVLPTPRQASKLIGISMTESVLLRFFTFYHWLLRNRLVIPECKQNMTSLRGQASWAKMTAIWGKLTALMCHPTKSVNKAE